MTTTPVDLSSALPNPALVKLKARLTGGTPIDLSGGFVPKATPTQQIQGLPAGATAEPIAQTPQIEGLPEGATAEPIDLSGGFVPKMRGTPVTLDMSKAQPLGGPPAPDGSAVDTPTTPKPSGIARIGSSFAQQSGIPTSMDELKAAQPSLAEEVGGPAVTAGKLAWNYGKNLLSQGKSAAGEVGDAYENIKEGQPVGQNIGKMGAAASDFALKGVLAPVGGAAVAQAGEDFKAHKIPEALGDVGAGALQAVTARDLAKGTPEPKPLAKTEDIAGTKMPVTVGQAATKANPTGAGPTVQGLEDLSRQLPFSDGLKGIARGQQTGAREVLANKAALSGAATSTAPEQIEQNFTNAAEQARQKGSAKYQEIGEKAKDADISEPTSVAASILSDPETSKILPKSTRDALSKVASGMSERETIARQIYGKGLADLDDSQKAEVGKATQGGPEPGGMQAALKARSELAGAANGSRDANVARLLHQGTQQMDEAIDNSLSAHDKANGTDLVGARKDANQLWTQKYAFENFRDGMQDIMKGAPSEGTRDIPGQRFMEFVNGLDPQGGGENSTLHRMFPGDEQSVKDVHKLADFMGKNQAHAGGMSGTMAKMRILGMKGTGLIANSTGFAWAMSKPGVAGALLRALQAGKNVAKASAAVGQLNHLLADAPDVPESKDDSQSTNLNQPENSQPKTANAAVSDQPATSATKTATNKNSSIPNATSTTITPPAGDQPNTTAQNRWVANAIEQAKGKNAQPDLSSNKWVSAAIARNRASNQDSTQQTENGAQSSTPPVSLWAGKEGKRLTLRNPANGRTEKWVLRKGTPTLAE